VFFRGGFLREFYGNITENSLDKQKQIDARIVVSSILKRR